MNYQKKQWPPRYCTSHLFFHFLLFFLSVFSLLTSAVHLEWSRRFVLWLLMSAPCMCYLCVNSLRTWYLTNHLTDCYGNYTCTASFNDAKIFCNESWSLLKKFHIVKKLRPLKNFQIILEIFILISKPLVSIIKGNVLTYMYIVNKGPGSIW